MQISLEGKTGLVLGVANKRSLAWGCARSLAREGMRLCFTYMGERMEKNVRELAAECPDSLVLPCDVTAPETIDEAARLVKENFSPKIDLLVNVSGILHIPGKMMPETSLARLKYDQMLLSYQTHAIGPALVCKAFWPLLQQSAKDDEAVLPAIANISARVGSISDNALGGWYSYRSSKSALNQLTKTMAVEFSRKKPKIATIALHPGTNDTDLSKPFQKNYPKDKIFPKEFGVQKMLEVIDGVQEEDNGKFYAWDGQEIPW